MAKTKPTGVRFDESLLIELKNNDIASSPQKALNFYENFYKTYKMKISNTEEVKIADLNKLTQSVKNITEPPPQTNYSIDTKKREKISDSERKDIENQIKDWENKKCPSYIMPSNFLKMKQKAIEELKSKL